MSDVRSIAGVTLLKQVAQEHNRLPSAEEDKQLYVLIGRRNHVFEKRSMRERRLRGFMIMKRRHMGSVCTRVTDRWLVLQGEQTA